MLDDGNFIEPEDTLDDFASLVDYLEQQQKRLRSRIEFASEEEDFPEIKAFKRALDHVTNQLSLLKNLRDPDHEQRKELYQRLIQLEQKISESSRNIDRTIELKDELRRVNESLDYIEKGRLHLIETQHIDYALFQLMERHIEYFRLCINDEYALMFVFSLEADKLVIRLTYNDVFYLYRAKKKLAQVGFFKTGKRQFVHRVNIQHLRDARVVKQTLAAVLFDVIGRSHIGKATRLETVGKSNDNQIFDDDVEIEES